MADETPEKKKPLPVNDGLTKTAEITAGGTRAHAFTITYRPATGLRMIAHDTDRETADGGKLAKLIETLIADHVIAIDGVRSAKVPDATPLQRTVKDLLQVLDGESILAIEQKIRESAWDVEKLLGN